jgi:peptide deformylase
LRASRPAAPLPRSHPLAGAADLGAAYTAAVAEEAGQVIVEDEELDPQDEARRRLALAQIRQWGDPALRLPAKPVEKFDDDLRRLVERMFALMRDAHGAGLAATQVGILRRVYVFETEADGAHAVVNPEIVERSDEAETDTEGCLSLEGVRVPVERAVSVTVAGKDEHGEDLRLELTGIGARVAQHEIDHLDGVLMIDRTDPESRRVALGILRPQPVLVLSG